MPEGMLAAILLAKFDGDFIVGLNFNRFAQCEDRVMMLFALGINGPAGGVFAIKGILDWKTILRKIGFGRFETRLLFADGNVDFGKNKVSVIGTARAAFRI